jgi:HAD superfamily hydrolase (TIGR01459 family)
MPLFEDSNLRRVPLDQAEIVLVTGLEDDERERPEDYRDRLQAAAARGLTLVSANPDIVVERGPALVWCAGALARLYQDIGGTVVQVGKPFEPIYREALATIAGLGGPAGAKGVLAIGDGLATDVRGAVDHGIDALFVTGGIHARDFGPPEAPDPALIGARLNSEGLKAVAAIPALAW